MDTQAPAHRDWDPHVARSEFPESLDTPNLPENTDQAQRPAQLELNALTVCLQRVYAPARLSATGMQITLISLAFRPRIVLYICCDPHTLVPAKEGGIFEQPRTLRKKISA